jgi:hypothetical protein
MGFSHERLKILVAVSCDATIVNEFPSLLSFILDGRELICANAVITIHVCKEHTVA